MRRVVAALTLLVGCSTHSEPPRPQQQQLFGDDRVAETLGREPSRAPRTIAEHEALFGIGRRCARTESHEVYVIEERATRFAEVMVPTAKNVPRAIITGCNPKPESLDGVAVSFGLMTVVPTDPSRPEDDPLAPSPIEVMALDRTTGAYSFYVFDDTGVQRIVRENGKVNTLLGARDGSITVRNESGQRCFGCHVNGAPIMASLGDPWISWVSTRSEKPGSYQGETASLVSESNQLATTKRASFANALEGVMRNAIRTFAVSSPPADLRARLRSVFCETELQFASAFDSVPLQLAIDPGAAAGSGITRPLATDAFPQLLPVRSDIDMRIEENLFDTGVLSEPTVRAIRMLDDANDIFSDKRCGLLPRVLAELPATGVDAYVRGVVRSVTTEPYALALLDGREDVAARESYFASLRKRVDAMFGDRAALERILAERQRRARLMFPGPSNPLPAAVAE